MNKTLRVLVGLCLITVVLALAACSKQKTVDYSQYEKIFLNASWSYNYADVHDLADHCDLAAYVKITGMENNDSLKAYGIDLTIYTAEIQESLFGKENGSIQLVMTGKIDEEEKKIYEIIDDPLMKIGDEFFVFAQLNEDGTYTTLTGWQGRFEIIDNLVYSLNVSNEQVAQCNSGASIRVDKLPKEEFYAQIREYVAGR